MRLPWQRRGDVAEMERRRDERRLRAIQADWPDVIAVNEELQYHRELNGWTGIADTLFAYHKKGEAK